MRDRAQMRSFGEMLWIIHSVGLYAQISANFAVYNHVSGNALFTEVPQDMVSQAGDDVEMACSFRGASSSSVSLEIQWWYTRDWAEQPSWTTNQVVSQENKPKGATKISVVKVVGSNISHKLRLSSVRPSDEGTYECRVTDFSESRAQQHRVQAYLQVQPDLQQEHQSPVHNRDQKKEEEKKTSEQNAGPEDHQKSHRKREEQSTQQVAYQFHEEDHHQLHEGNKTNTNQRAEI
ncbi:V-set and transmembrane domain-containing protein 2-like protein [Sinocyclocheilus rhinocerous]|uniref:V-set and transmembrane domain-containing protein 2-like protein n=1 Tax=Sinocyclocheilus rhinocerous TaxID=307959 RepID=A0A673NGK5_9TELE|nr:PREDICTED: V-set and transmembrane domain-containing protein 2-like protein [Sinocyclocheilus rhinocerous]